MANPYDQLLINEQTSDNPYDSMVLDQSKQEIRNTMNAAVDVNPDQDAKFQALSKKYNIPVDSIRLNPAPTIKQSQLDSIDYDDLAKNMPVTRNFLADPNNANISHDDVQNMGTFEKAWQGFKNIVGALASSVTTTNSGLWGLAQAGSDMLSQVTKPLSENGILPEDIGGRMSAQFASYRHAQDNYTKSLMPQGNNVLSNGFYQGIQGTGQFALNLPLMFINPALGITSMTLPSAGQSYGEARDKGVSLPLSLSYSASQGAIAYATSKIPVATMLKGWQEGASLPKMFLSTLATNIPADQIQQHLSDLNSWAVINPRKTLSDYLSERPESALQTLVGTITGTALMAGSIKGTGAIMDKFADKERISAEAKNASNFMDALGSFAKTSKLLQRSPEAFNDYVNQVTDNANIYVPADKFVELFQGSNENPYVLAEKAGINLSDLQDAIATKTDIAMPVANYMSNFANTEFSEGIKNIAKLRPDGTSLESLQERQAQIEKDIQNLTEQATRDNENNDDWNTIRDNVAVQLQNAGFDESAANAQSALTASVFSTLAKRSGISSLDLYKKYDPSISRPDLDAANNVNLSSTQEQLDPVSDLISHIQRIAPDADINSIRSALSENNLIGDDYVRDLYTKAKAEKPEGETVLSQRVGALDNVLNTIPDDIPFKTALSNLNDQLKQNGITTLNQSSINDPIRQFLEGDPVVKLTGNEFQKDAQPITEKVAQYYKDTNNQVVHVDGIGDVNLDKAAIKNSISHGLGKTKAAAYAAVPDILKKGVIVDESVSKRDDNTTGYMISAPVQIGDDHYVGIVLVRSDKNINRMYVHEVVLTKKLRESAFKTEASTTDKSALNGANSGVIRSILQKIFSVNESDYSVKKKGDDSGNETTLNQDAADYQGYHKPTKTGGTADDITMGGDLIPEDFYDHPSWYADMSEPSYKESFRVLKSIRGNPNATVTIYRATKGDSINYADWVTLSKTYAKDHMEMYLEGEEGAKIVSKKVKAKDIHFAGDDINEFGYYPETELNQTERGRIRFGQDKKFNIELLQNADLSTFLHESGHMYFEILGDLSELPDAPKQIKEDYAQILNWLGVKDRSNIGTEQHEKFARGFELYLGEGKSPTIEAQNMFSRFKLWITSIYKTLTNLNVKLNDDVRQVFDRLIATDDQIELASKQQGYDSVFATAKDAGMTDQEFEAYKNIAQQAHDEAVDSLQKKAILELKREQNKYYKDALEKATQKVTNDVNSSKLYQALTFLQKGTMADGSALPEGMAKMKISKDILVEKYGKEILKQLPKPYIYSKEGGVHPDVVADLFGYDSGDAMINDFTSAIPKEQLIKQLATAQVKETHGDMMLDGSIADKAMQSIHNDKKADVMRMELRSLKNIAQGLRKIRAEDAAARREANAEVPKLADFREAAKRAIANKHVRDLNPNEFLQAERRANKESYELAGKGKHQEAAAAKQRELLNHFMYREAIAAREEVEKISDLAKGYTKPKKRAALGLKGQNFLQAMDNLLGAYSFDQKSNRQAGFYFAGQLNDRAERLQQAIELQKSITDLVNSEEAKGEDVQIELPEFVQQGLIKPYQLLTIGQLRDLGDTIKSIAHLANIQGKLLDSKKAETLNDAVSAMVASIEAHNKINTTEFKFSETQRDKLTKWLQNADAWLTKPEALFMMLDGDKHGALWEHIFKPIADAENTEMTMWKKTAEDVNKIFNKYSKKEQVALYREKHFIKSINQSMTKGDIMSVALNWGNADNRDAILQGFKWSNAQVQEMLGKLTDKDWDVVQSIWDHIDSFWPDIKKLQEDMVGIAPEKVQASAFATPSGRTMRGGYYPLKYDPKYSDKQNSRNETEDVMKMWENNVGRASTKKGHTIERVGSGGQPVKLGLSVYSQHLQEVIHDLAFRKAITDVNRLINHPDFVSAFKGATSTEMYRTLTPWLKRVANDASDRQASSFWEKFIGRARAGSTIAYMGFKFTTMLAQPLGLTNTINEIGSKWVMKGLKESIYNSDAKKFEFAKNFVFERSPMMANRMNTFDRDVRDTIKKLDGKQGKLDNLRLASMHMTSLLDMSVAIPSWLGAYYKKMNETHGDENAAIDYADSVVRYTQSSGSAKDLSRIQGGSEYQRMFTMFYSYFNALYQMEKRSVKRLIDNGAGGVPKFIAEQTWLWIVPYFIGEIVAGRGVQDQDWDEWLKSKALGFLSYPFQSIVGVRDILNGLDQYGYSISPVSDAIGLLSKSIKSGSKIMNPDDEVDKSDVRTLVNTVGIFAGLPSQQAWITGSYLYDLATDQSNPADPFEFTRNMMFTRPKNQQ